MKLHLGAGKHPIEGYVNIDQTAMPGIEVVADLGDCRKTKLPFDDDSVDEITGSHVIEHIVDTLSLMQELHRVAKAGATCTFRLPYGSNDDAWENPTHVRPYFLQSFGYFSQPFYWREDYGYTGDWRVKRLTLAINSGLWESKGGDADKILHAVNTLRNVVLEMTVVLEAVKPIREPQKELQEAVHVELARANVG